MCSPAYDVRHTVIVPGFKAVFATACIVLSLQGIFSPWTFADDRFGAIAYSKSSGRYGYGFGKTSRSDAENAALQECGSSDAFIAVWAKNRWIALAAGYGTTYGYGWSGESEADAQSRSLSACSEHGSGCHVLVSVYAGGYGKAKVVIIAPEDARVSVGDYQVGLSGGVGQFDSADLLGGRPYTYSLVAHLLLDGKDLEERVTASVTAHETTIVSFPELQSALDFRTLSDLSPEAPQVQVPDSLKDAFAGRLKELEDRTQQ